MTLWQKLKNLWQGDNSGVEIVGGISSPDDQMTQYAQILGRAMRDLPVTTDTTILTKGFGVYTSPGMIELPSATQLTMYFKDGEFWVVADGKCRLFVLNVQSYTIESL